MCLDLIVEKKNKSERGEGGGGLFTGVPKQEQKTQEVGGWGGWGGGGQQTNKNTAFLLFSTKRVRIFGSIRLKERCF